METFAEENKKMFDKHATLFESADYWRSDEEHASQFLRSGKLLIGGIGGGRTVAPLLKKGYDITGLDISPEMVAACKRRFPNLDVRVGDLQKTDFANNTFDSIFLPFHTICYVDDLETTLREMRRILKPGGTFACSMVNRWFITSILTSIWKPKRYPENMSRGSSDMIWTIHASYFDVRTFREIFGSASVRGRVSLQALNNPNWKDRLLGMFPFVDKTLYFFAKKVG